MSERPAGLGRWAAFALLASVTIGAGSRPAGAQSATPGNRSLGAEAASPGDLLPPADSLRRPPPNGPVRFLGAPATLAPGARERVELLVRNADGTRVRFPRVRWASSDTSVIAVDADGSLRAVGPGEATLEARTPQGAAEARLRVEGVTLLVNDRPRRFGGALLPTDRVVLDNGRLRLYLGAATERGQNAGVVVDVRDSAQWVPGTSREYGDYTYVGSSVDTRPTAVEVIAVSAREVAVRQVFARHVFEPDGLGLGPEFERQPYGFSKTVWLRAEDDGYFALVRLHETLPLSARGAEHEIGFGGLWGPGTVATGSDTVVIGPEGVESRRLNVPPRLDALTVRRLGDPLVRVLVPLRESPFVVPYFGPTRFGGGWIHQLTSDSYGAYLYMAPLARARPAPRVCADAWRDPPFLLTTRPRRSELQRCGHG